MSIEYTKGAPVDRDDIIDLANYVFSHSDERVDFPTLLPKLYGEHANTSVCHHIVKENGKIKGMVGVFPSLLSVCGEAIKVAGIGTVCVHPYSRGSGYMKTLMANALKEIENGKYDLAVLAGQRQRYQYFGFEQCGQILTFTISAASARHCFKDFGGDAKLVPLEGDFAELAYQLYNTRHAKVFREKEAFLPILYSWNAKPFAFVKDGAFAGYISVQCEKHTILELSLTDEALLADLLSAYFIKFAPSSLKIKMSPAQYMAVKGLAAVCESVEAGNDGGFLVINFQRVLLAALKLKATYAALPSGKAVVEILGRGKYLIRISDEECSVTQTTEAADVVLSYLDAMNCFFSPLSAFVPNYELPYFLKLLLPLPLYIDKCDMV